MIKSDQIACADENGLPTGKFLDVENTPFDFKSFHEIGERIHDDDEQLRFVGGYDHCFMLKDEKDHAVLYDKESGRKLRSQQHFHACSYMQETFWQEEVMVNLENHMRTEMVLH